MDGASPPRVHPLAVCSVPGQSAKFKILSVIKAWKSSSFSNHYHHHYYIGITVIYNHMLRQDSSTHFGQIKDNQWFLFLYIKKEEEEINDKNTHNLLNKKTLQQVNQYLHHHPNIIVTISVSLSSVLYCIHPNITLIIVSPTSSLSSSWYYPSQQKCFAFLHHLCKWSRQFQQLPPWQRLWRWLWKTETKPKIILVTKQSNLV